MFHEIEIWRWMANFKKKMKYLLGLSMNFIFWPKKTGGNFLGGRPVDHSDKF